MTSSFAYFLCLLQAATQGGSCGGVGALPEGLWAQVDSCGGQLLPTLKMWLHETCRSVLWRQWNSLEMLIRVHAEGSSPASNVLVWVLVSCFLFYFEVLVSRVLFFPCSSCPWLIIPFTCAQPPRCLLFDCLIVSTCVSLTCEFSLCLLVLGQIVFVLPVFVVVDFFHCKEFFHHLFFKYQK